MTQRSDALMDVVRLRDQIPVCQKMVYMNTGWSGPSPVPIDRGPSRQRLEYEMEQGPTTQGRLRERTRDSRRRSTPGGGAASQCLDPEEICLTENTTEGLNIVVNGLPWREGDEIITFELEHSSVLVPSYYQQRRHGVVVKGPLHQPPTSRGK